MILIHVCFSDSQSDMVKDHARSAADKSKAIDKESDLTQEAQDELKARRLQESKRRKTLADLKHHLKTLQDELTGVVESENVQVSGYFRGIRMPLSSSYNIPGLVPACWLLFQCF